MRYVGVILYRAGDGPIRSDRRSRSLTETRQMPTTDDRVEATVSWLEDEFPGWTFEVTGTRTWSKDGRPLWIARMEGHHPQAEMSAAKLHTRLTEYLEREARRVALTN